MQCWTVHLVLTGEEWISGVKPQLVTSFLCTPTWQWYKNTRKQQRTGKWPMSKDHSLLAHCANCFSFADANICKWFLRCTNVEFCTLQVYIRRTTCRWQYHTSACCRAEFPSHITHTDPKFDWNMCVCFSFVQKIVLQKPLPKGRKLTYYVCRIGKLFHTPSHWALIRWHINDPYDPWNWYIHLPTNLP